MIEFGSLFSGFGGMDLGLERAGMKCLWQVEKNSYAQKILAKHWPDVRRYDDVATFPVAGFDWRARCIAGGFPCQPVSCAGRREARSDPRWLWPHFARIIGILRPEIVILENVPGILVELFGDVLGDLSEMGFDAEWATIPASAVGAPHLRERVFVVAYANKVGRGGVAGKKGPIVTSQHRKLRSKKKNSPSNTDSERPTPRIFRQGPAFDSLPRICWGSDKPGVDRTSYGIPHRMERIAGLGNAVVPAVAELIGKLVVGAFDGEGQ